MKKFSLIIMMLASQAALANVITIRNPQQFDQEIIKSGKQAVVKVGATWCPACVRAHEPFHALANEYPNIVFADVDSDANSSVVSTYSVQSLPTFLFFSNGKKVKDTTGFSKKQIKDLIAQYLSGAAAPAAPAAPAQPAVDVKKNEAVMQETASDLEQPKAESEMVEGGACEAQTPSFFERAYNATRDFFVAGAEKVRSWFR